MRRVRSQGAYVLPYVLLGPASLSPLLTRQAIDEPLDRITGFSELSQGGAVLASGGDHGQDQISISGAAGIQQVGFSVYKTRVGKSREGEF